IYSVLTVISFQIVGQFKFSEKYWTVYIFKTAFGVNMFGSKGATLGKPYIAIHQYLVIRSREFSEKKWTASVMRRLMLLQFVISVVLTAPVWPASYAYQKDVIIALEPLNTLILKVSSVVTYLLYIMCNGLLLVLTSRELLRLRGYLKEDAATTRSIMTQQRNMFIIVSVCSLSHLIKTLQQV
ncbi:hypothetical protein PENTCL1PPCAC_21082, partial [Pristionchus entomophagus]